MSKWHCTRCDVDWDGEPRCWSCGSNKYLEPPTPPPSYSCYGEMSAPG